MKDTGFRNQMLLLSLLPTVLVAVLLSAIFVTWSFHEVEQEFKERARAISRQVGTSVEYGIFTGNNEMLRALAEAACKGDPEILGVSVLDSNGRAMIRIGNTAPQELTMNKAEQSYDHEDRIIMATQIVKTVLPIDDVYSDAYFSDTPKNASAGYLVLEVSRARLIESRKAQLLIGIGIILGGLALGIGLALHMARGISRPLTHIIDVVDQIGRNELHARVNRGQLNSFSALGSNINAMAERIERAHDDLQLKIDDATEELRVRIVEVEHLARIDSLTGVANRRAFIEQLELAVVYAQRYQTPLSVVIIDLDLFKLINDTYGHAVGDHVLTNRAQLIARAIREVDMVGRLGGEEFGILMPETSLEEAVNATERFRSVLEANPVRSMGATVAATASFGVAHYIGPDMTMETLLSRADRALYQAKARGRNRVEAYE